MQSVAYNWNIVESGIKLHQTNHCSIVGGHNYLWVLLQYLEKIGRNQSQTWVVEATDCIGRCKL
jgi:hypothetical protein